MHACIRRNWTTTSHALPLDISKGPKCDSDPKTENLLSKVASGNWPESLYEGLLRLLFGGEGEQLTSPVAWTRIDGMHIRAWAALYKWSLHSTNGQTMQDAREWHSDALIMRGHTSDHSKRQLDNITGATFRLRCFYTLLQNALQLATPETMLPHKIITRFQNLVFYNEKVKCFGVI